jgi:hypothetical protein
MLLVTMAKAGARHPPAISRKGSPDQQKFLGRNLFLERQNPMKTCTFGRRNFLTLMVAAFALGCVALCSAQGQSTASVAGANVAKTPSSAPAGAATSSAKKPTEEELPSKGMNTGIKVHGHWVIEVRNPDGKLVARREFENSLAPGGQNFLATFLSRQYSVGAWEIWLISSDNTKNVCTFSGNPVPCQINEPNSGEAPGCTGGPTSCFATLQVTPPPSGGWTFSLSGSAVAAVAGVIDTVQTYQNACTSATSPSACGTEPALNPVAGPSGQFSGTTLLAPGSGQCGGASQPSCELLNVLPQQVINVTVTYSFQ